MIKNLLAFSALSLSVFSAVSQTPGSLDQTFGGTGQVIVSPVSVESFDNCQAVGVQSTGKTVFCGVSGNWSNFEATVGRLNVDGTLDASFASNGVFIYNNTLGGDFMYDLKVLNDDKILICGATSLSAANTQWAVWRLLPDGALDATFGVGGVMQWDIEGGEDYSREIIVQNDGYLVVGGSMPAGFSIERIVVAKLDLNGALVPSFGTNAGYTMFTTNAQDDVVSRGATLMPNGSIFIVGSSYSMMDNMDHPMIAVLDNAGAPLTSVDDDGIWIDPAYGRYYRAVYQNGHVLACGNRDGSEYNFMLAAHLADGSFDNTFGFAGVSISDNDNIDVFYDLTIQGDGKILACGTTGQGGFGGSRDFCLMRFNADGTLDLDFGTNGLVVTTMAAGFEDANSLALTSDFKVVCGGFVQQVNNDFAFARYHLGTVILVDGCTDATACNYNPNASNNDGSCYFVGDPCNDGNMATLNDVYNANCECAGSVTSVEQLESVSIALFPNPAKEVLNVQNWKNGHVVIYDYQGRIVMDQQLEDNVIAVKQLSSGIYRILVDGHSIAWVKE